MESEPIGVREANIRSLACNDELQEGIAVYAAGLVEVLGDNLRGVYLYGSLARGCYHPSTSDLDIIVVTRGVCVEAQHPGILRVHESAGAPVDAVFVAEDQVDADVFPAQIDFLVKPMSGHSIFRKPEGSRDFLLQREDAYEAGIALLGTDPSEIIRPVPWPLLAECLDFLFPHIVANFKNPVLMLCRLAYAHAHRSLCCKQHAGEWASEAFGARWRQIIEAALNQYSQGVVGSAVPPEVLQEFEEYCAGYISSLQSNRGIVCSNSVSLD